MRFVENRVLCGITEKVEIRRKLGALRDNRKKDSSIHLNESANISHESLFNLTINFGTLKYKVAVHKGSQIQRNVDSEWTFSDVQLYGIQRNLP